MTNHLLLQDTSKGSMTGEERSAGLAFPWLLSTAEGCGRPVSLPSLGACFLHPLHIGERCSSTCPALLALLIHQHSMLPQYSLCITHLAAWIRMQTWQHSASDVPAPNPAECHRYARTLQHSALLELLLFPCMSHPSLTLLLLSYAAFSPVWRRS